MFLPTISSLNDLILNHWNKTEKSFAQHKTINQLFEEKAQIQPNNTALITSSLKMSYGELNNKSNIAARKLNSLGVIPNTFVGILLPRNEKLIISLLAILKNGSAYVPMNLTDPNERIEKIIASANLTHIITDEKNKQKIKGSDIKIILIEELTDDKEDIINTNIEVTFNSNQPAYIIFTSGSTGTPKGVLVNHKSVINLIEWVNNTFNVASSDRLLWITNLSFDLSVYDIFGILAAGGQIRIVSDEDRMDPKRQLEIIIEEKITFWDSAPQSLQHLTPFLTHQKYLDNSSLRLVFLSGDWIPLTLPPIIWNSFSQVEIVGLGGATEATVWSNYFIINQIKPEWNSIPYGVPIQNSRYYILNDNLEHCGINEPGDLYIGGICLAVEYYNDPELTKRKFLEDPFVKGDRIYHTGDKAQWMGDGNIEFLGREDNQVKVRGFRIELGEIKDVVIKNRLIKDAILVPDKTNKHDIKIILFITTEENSKIDKNEIKEDLRQSLPDYMIPFDIVQYNEFPATPNGKIDTKYLIDNYIKNKSQINKTENKILVFNSSIEREVYKLWTYIFNNTDIGIDDDFFEIGGDSIHAINLLNQIEKKFSCRISFRDFLAKYHSVRKMAELIESIQEGYKNISSGHDVDKYQHIFCLSSEGEKPPVFAIYCEKVFSAKNMLKSEHPIYSFVWPGVDGKEFEFTTVEEVASSYLQQILKIQPKGPYFIVGYSFGGYVAFEIAVMLQKKLGQKPLVVLLDTWHPQVEFKNRDKLLRKKEINGLPYALIDYYLLRGFRFTKERYCKVKRILKKKLRQNYTGEEINEIIITYAERTGTSYRPNFFDGELILFKTHENPISDPDLGWRDYVKHINTFNIKGDHKAVLNDIDNILFISDKLYEYFNKQAIEV